MKVYLSGAITNNPAYKKSFAEAERRVARMGHEAVNPVKLASLLEKEFLESGKKMPTYADYYMIDGWQESRGAILEHAIATSLEMPVFYPEMLDSIEKRTAALG